MQQECVPCASKNRGIEEIRNEVEQKIRQEVDRLLLKAYGNEGPGKNVSGDQEPGEGVDTAEAVSGVEEPGEGVNTVVRFLLLKSLEKV